MSSFAGTAAVPPDVAGTPAVPSTCRRHSRRSMRVFAHSFGLNHAAATTPILYQVTYLGDALGNLDNATLYAALPLTSMFLAGLLHERLGARLGLTTSMVAFALSVALFVAALLCPSQEYLDEDGVVALRAGAGMTLCALLGSVVGGFAAGLDWTLQGVVIGQIIDQVAEEEAKDKLAVSAEMWSLFGFWLLGWEAAVRALTTVLLQAGCGAVSLFVLHACLAALAAGLWFCRAPPDARTSDRSASCHGAVQAVRLWKDPKMWLLQFTNLAFGFAAGWNASYIGPRFTSKALGSDFIGFTGALISLVAGLASKLLGHAAPSTGKTAIVLFGSLAFLCLGVLSLVLGDAEFMGFGVLIFPVCLGLGRAVYESINKGLFNDFYPSPETRAGVFGNVMMFSTLSSIVVFILDGVHQSQFVIYLLIGCCVCTVPGLGLAFHLRQKGSPTLTHGRTASMLKS